MPLSLMQHVLQKADEAGSRSTVLKTPCWIASVLVTALVITSSGHSATPIWVPVALAVLLAGTLGGMAWAYFYFATRDKDALRSERFSIQKLAIERGLVGDSLKGLFVPDSPTSQVIDQEMPRQIEKQQ